MAHRLIGFRPGSRGGATRSIFPLRLVLAHAAEAEIRWPTLTCSGRGVALVLANAVILRASRRENQMYPGSGLALPELRWECRHRDDTSFAKCSKTAIGTGLFAVVILVRSPSL